MASVKPKPKLLVIVGETASGKSALAHKIAQEFNGEIISADSWAVYKGFDIGTAKPSEKEQKTIRYHLIDVADARKGFNAPTFKKMAEEALQAIESNSRLPIVVGGTGLYVDSLLFDYSFLPNSGEQERTRLNNLSISELLGEAAAKGINLGGVDIRNKRRIVRAIESGGKKPKKTPLKKDILIIGLKKNEQQLSENISKRVDQMFMRGLEREVKNLSSKYGWEAEAMKGIGYQEFKEYFMGSQTLEETKSRIISNTKSLAKRQRTWFKRNPNIKWFSSVEEAHEAISRILNT